MVQVLRRRRKAAFGSNKSPSNALPSMDIPLNESHESMVAVGSSNPATQVECESAAVDESSIPKDQVEPQSSIATNCVNPVLQEEPNRNTNSGLILVTNLLIINLAVIEPFVQLDSVC